MAWIESHQELRDHPKTKRAARLLGIGVPQVVGHLHFLWWWALDYAEDGDLASFDEYDIAEAAGWDGDADEFLEALMGCGPGDREGFLTGAAQINDWDIYAGRLINQREANRERQRKYREKQAKKHDNVVTEPLRNSNVTRDKRVSNAATVPNQTKPNQEKEGRGAAPNGSAPPSPIEQELTPAERYVVDCVRGVRGAGQLSAPDVIAHIRECIANRSTPVGEFVMRSEFQKFRDYWQEKRANQPKDKKWTGWKRAITNWLAKLDEDEPEVDVLTGLYGPEYGVHDGD